MNLVYSPAAILLAALALSPDAPRSDQTGVYGIVDEVVFRPNAKEPKSAELRGIFAVAVGTNGDEYYPATPGYLAFTIRDGEEKQTLDQWRDIERLAGSGECVAFGMRYEQRDVRVRPLAEGDVVTTPFVAHMGVRKMGHVDYPPVRQLRYVPRPKTPGFGAELRVRGGPFPAMRVLLSVRNCLADDEKLRYLFEVSLPNGETIGSPPIEPDAGETSWDVQLALQPDDEITWRVRVIGSGLDTVPVAVSKFRAVKKAQ